eukprot:jgi/Tetstr1/441472/TSEL_003115.t1
MSGGRPPVRLYPLLGAGCFLLAVVALMRGHQHTEVHHEAMSAREAHREQFQNSGFSVKSTFARMRSLEEGVVHAISDKLHHISDTMHEAHGDPILDAPAGYSRGGHGAPGAAPLGRPPVPAVAVVAEEGSPPAAEQAGAEERGEGVEGQEGEVDSPQEGEEGYHEQDSEEEGEEADSPQEGEEGSPQEGSGEEDHEIDVAGQIDPATMEHLLNATLQGEDSTFASALNATVAKARRHRRAAPSARAGQPSGANARHAPASKVDKWETEHSALAARIRNAKERRSPPHAASARALVPRSARHSPRGDKAAQVEAGGVVIESARGDEHDGPDMALSPRDQGRKYKRGKHCGGMCILHQLERRKGKIDKEWVTNEDGSFLEDGSPAQDDGSACQGRCGRHGFCRQGRCVCTVLYEGELCDQPKEVPGLRTKFDGSFLFNSAKLRNSVGKYLKYTCNPKKGTSETHTVRVRITDALVEVLPAVDPMHGRLYDRCAVVGNSGVLGNYGFGPAIDGHDAVFRFNVGPTRGYAPQVGSRTTFRLVNTNHAGWHENKEADIQQLQSMIGLLLYVKYRRQHPNAKLFAFDPEFSTYVSSNLRVLPTGGYFAIWMAMQRCAQVSVYGFHFEPGFGIRHHYFNGEKPLKGKEAIHDYDAEYRKIKYMAKMKYLTLMEPCIAGCPEESGIPSVLPEGAACQCGTGNPMPVAKQGYCRLQGSFTCFLKCVSPIICIGQEHKGPAANQPEGGCVAPMMKKYEAGEVACEPNPGAQ